MFYVYVHFTKDGLIPFYIGKGKGKRINDTYNRNRYWNRIVKKHGFVSDTLKYFDNEQQAFDYEVEMIKFFKAEGVKLANLSLGGEGASGVKRSKAEKEKLSNLYKGKKFGFENANQIIATNKDNGTEITMQGNTEIKELGFNPSHVSKCIRGIRQSHKNHTFRFA